MRVCLLAVPLGLSETESISLVLMHTIVEFSTCNKHNILKDTYKQSPQVVDVVDRSLMVDLEPHE